MPVVIDECESLALSGHLVLGEEDARDVAEGPEQLLKVVVLHVLGEVGHADGGCVLVPPPASNSCVVLCCGISSSAQQ